MRPVESFSVAIDGMSYAAGNEFAADFVEGVVAHPVLPDVPSAATQPTPTMSGTKARASAGRSPEAAIQRR